MQLVLLVEDDRSLGSTLKERLEKEGYSISWCPTLKEARAVVSRARPRLAIVDITLPDGSGFDLVPTLRACGIPFLFLTALNSAEHRLRGYELGADEFIPKPFHLKELLLRLKRLLSHTLAPAVIVCGSVQVDLRSMCLTYEDGTHEFPNPRDVRLLKMLLDAAPQVVSRADLLKALFPTATEGAELPTPRTIDNSIVRLRQLLRRGQGDFIRSVRGIGYQWAPTGTGK